MEIKLLINATLLLMFLWVSPRAIMDKKEIELPRRMVLCSGKVISPNITFIRNDSLEALGTCYGYANCTACSNCSLCKHCNNGGSCGVCSYSGSYNQSRVVTPPSPPKPEIIKPKADIDMIENNTNVESYIKYDNTNLRYNPSISSPIIKKLSVGDKIIKISKSDDYTKIEPYGTDVWYEVRTEDNNLGWVFGKMVTDEEVEDEIGWAERNNIIGSYTYIKGDRVNLRSKPIIVSNNIITKLDFNDKCIIQGRSDEMETIAPYGEDYWYEVNYNSSVGWIFGKFLTEEPIKNDYNTCVITGRFVNVRLEPSSNSVIMGRVYLNEKCMILEKSTFETSILNYGTNHWYKIRSNRNEGWVFGKFIDLE
jgi:uncharacterized protein YgiM (DUF1202 family)